MTKLTIAGREYEFDVHRRVTRRPGAPRLVVVSYLPTEMAAELLRVCIRSIQHFTDDPHELWIIDNNSPEQYCMWLSDWTDLNVVFNHTDPTPPDTRSKLAGLFGRKNPNQQTAGSWANGIALEIAVRVIDTDSRFLMSLHMDTMPCHPGWLTHLTSKIQGKVAASGVRMDTARTPEGVLHCLGMLVDFQRFRELGLDFMPRLPEHDVGDRVTVELRRHGFEVFACPNTLWQPELIESIPVSSPLRDLTPDRAFDDDGNIIFLHLGRGVSKARGKRRAGATPQEWIKFAEEHMFTR